MANPSSLTRPCIACSAARDALAIVTRAAANDGPVCLTVNGVCADGLLALCCDHCDGSGRMPSAEGLDFIRLLAPVLRAALAGERKLGEELLRSLLREPDPDVPL